MAAYTSIDNPELYFQTVLWTGNGTAIGSGGLAVTFDGSEDMAPNLVWIKGRSTTYSHQIYDTIRGVTKRIFSDISTPEETDTEALTAFGSDGFTLGSNAGVNTSDGTYVAWSWVESTTAGFDMVSFSGNQTDRDVSHNLSAVPEFCIIKNREYNDNAHVYHVGNGATCTMEWQTTGAKNCSNVDGIWQDTTPTSSVVKVGDNGNINRTGDDIILYVFTGKQGFSKFGAYTGNGNADGAFVHTGFRPAWTMIKRTDSTDGWFIFNNKMNTYNPLTKYHVGNTTAAEAGDSGNAIDFTANGFKFYNNGNSYNASGGTYIYAAFAEASFVNSNGVPGNAR